MRMTVLQASGGSIGGPVLPSARKRWLGAPDRGHGPTPDAANGRTFAVPNEGLTSVPDTGNRKCRVCTHSSTTTPGGVEGAFRDWDVGGTTHRSATNMVPWGQRSRCSVSWRAADAYQTG